MKKRKFLITAIAAIIVIALAVFAYFWFNNLHSKNDSSNSSQEQNSDGSDNGSKDSSGEAVETTAPVEKVSAVSGPGQITLSWVVPESDIKATGFEIKYSTTSDFVDSKTTTSSESTKTITGLTAGTTYYVIVRAIDPAGNAGEWSKPVTVTPAAANTYDVFLAVNVVGSKADYIWQLVGTDITPVDHFEVQWGTTPGVSTIIGSANVSTNGASSGSYTLPGLRGGVTYYLRARAIEKNGAQRVWSATNIFSVASAPAAIAQDTTAPSQVTDLVASPGDGIVYLRWNQATDNVGVVGYEYGFSDVAYQQPTANSLVDVTGILGNSVNRPGLINNLSYSFWVRAYDAAGNRGSWSVGQTATPFRVTDTERPSQVTGVVATSSNGQVTISGYTATDNVGIDHYALWWSTTSITPTGLPNVTPITTSTYQVNNLTNDIVYYFWVAASDAAGNWSLTKSVVVSAAPSASAPDTTAPSQVTGLGITAGNAEITLFGYTATDNVGVSYYEAYYRSSQDQNATAPTADSSPMIPNIIQSSLRVTSLPNGVPYYYWMRAVDAAGNKGPWSDMVPGTPSASASDITKPSTVTGLTVLPGDSMVTLQFYTATDNVGVVSYNIYYNTTGTVSGPPQITGVTEPTIPIFGLQDGTTYYFWMKAVDAAGNKSLNLSDRVSATPMFIDNEAPSQVVGLSAVPGDTNVDLSWGTATDNLAVTGYDVEYGTTTDFSSSLFATSPTNNINISNLMNDATHYFRVRAYDSANNKGPWSDVISSTPVAPGDTTPPSPVTNLVVTPGDAKVDLTWTAATDNLAVTGYDIDYGTSAEPGVTHSVTNVSTNRALSGLINGAFYSFSVRAFDAAGNKGNWDTVNATPLPPVDSTPPSQVTGIVATPGDLKVTLSGYTATDNVAVDYYALWYNTTGVTPSGAPNVTHIFTSTYNVTSLSNGQLYYFWMSAKDMRGNQSTVKSVAVTATPTEPVDTTPPSQVQLTGLRVMDREPGGVDIVFAAASDNVAVTGYDIEYTNVSEGQTFDVTNPIPTVGISGLIPGMLYTFKIRAYDAAGNKGEWSSSFNVNPAVPSTPLQTLVLGNTPNVVVNSTTIDGTGWNGQGMTTFKTNGSDAVWDGTNWWAAGFNTSDVSYGSLNTSTDGVNWTKVITPMTSGNVTGITYGVVGGVPTYVAVGSAPGANMMYKQGSGDWTVVPNNTTIFSTTGSRVAWNGSKFVAVGRGTNNIAWSSDGVTWYGLGFGFFGVTSYGYDIAWNGTYWLAVGNGNNIALWSLNGIDWTPISLAGILTQGNGVSWSDVNNTWVIVGNGTYTIAFAQDTHLDPVNYPPSFASVPTSKSAIFTSTGKDVTWDGSRFVATGIGGNGIALSTDGIAWTGLGTSVVTTGKGVVSNKQPYTGAYWNTPVGVKGSQTTAGFDTKLLYMSIAGLIAFALSIYLVFSVYRRRNS